ncbi:MAG: class I SAM-dependent methyltransferase [Candidatus Komeilibacteria bacterium]|nr:class I SAM-dependent methyltransferase [Candidatus Komeilibacteria bacterium]
MVWGIEKTTGVIQLTKLLPLEILYLNQHNDGVGKIWQDHYLAFANFLKKYEPRSVLEIGGANDFIANNYLNQKQAEWTIVEPHPQFVSSDKVKVIKSWFDDKFSISGGEIDIIIHSHVLEHVYDPNQFLGQISSFLKDGQKHIFTFPKMLEMLKNNYTNCLNFEHTVFLTEELVDYLLEQNGFKILEKEYFGNPHSIFYATEKDSQLKPTKSLPNKYNEYKQIFLDFVNYHQAMVAELNKRIINYDGPIYLFGAHIFSQYLIGFGLETKRIVSILDNSQAKQGQRLYGTDFKVESPKVLAGQKQAAVILKAGIYNEEIKKDILENINSEVIFW